MGGGGDWFVGVEWVLGEWLAGVEYWSCGLK